MRLSLPSLLATSIFVCSAAVAACSASTDSSTSSGSSALASASTGDGGSFDPTACLTTYAEAVRAAGAPTDDARKALHECLRPPRPSRGDGGPGCGDGKGGGGGDGDHDGPGHGPPPDADGGPMEPPPPPPDADGGAPPDGPRACMDALDTCAEGTDDLSTCVSTAVACLDALPKPPRPGRGPRDH